MIGIYVVIAVVVALFVYLWSTYNGLIMRRMRVKESWSGIDVQLKRRMSLIPNLIETVKGYAAHEKTVFEHVTEARSALMKAGNAQEAAEADNMLTGALKSLFAVAENYPDLKASENFKQLQSELGDTEDKIAYARQFYNSNVMDYNVKIKVFPAVFVAGMFGFHEETFFKAADEERADVKVDFSQKSSEQQQ